MYKHCHVLFIINRIKCLIKSIEKIEFFHNLSKLAKKLEKFITNKLWVWWCQLLDLYLISLAIRYRNCKKWSKIYKNQVFNIQSFRQN